MTEREDGDWRRYRCPVCSHSDAVSLAGTEAVLIQCSHCDTPLTVKRRDSDSVDVTVADGGSRKAPEEAS
ncbi:MAG: hypothetical protein PVI57_11290 [Gemmatimonadota bacterium]|jgi:transcription elongation factor Elf1